MSITKIQPRPLNSGRGNGKSIEFPSPQRHLLADIAFLVYVLTFGAPKCVNHYGGLLDWLLIADIANLLYVL